tara:strand:+ start:752 stop:1006 length:255 start_codon:yes stop_codon:yes gene_type:complete
MNPREKNRKIRREAFILEEKERKERASDKTVRERILKYKEIINLLKESGSKNHPDYHTALNFLTDAIEEEKKLQIRPFRFTDER